MVRLKARLFQVEFGLVLGLCNVTFKGSEIVVEGLLNSDAEEGYPQLLYALGSDILDTDTDDGAWRP